jgi:hypothetical protein
LRKPIPRFCGQPHTVAEKHKRAATGKIRASLKVILAKNFPSLVQKSLVYKILRHRFAPDPQGVP